MPKKPTTRADVDLRKLPKDKRPKPTTGQSAEPFPLPFDELSPNETKVVKTLNAPGSGLRQVRKVAAVAKSARLTPLQVRNAIRRLVPSRWIEHDPDATPGAYRVSELGRKRVDSALSGD